METDLNRAKEFMDGVLRNDKQVLKKLVVLNNAVEDIIRCFDILRIDLMCAARTLSLCTIFADKLTGKDATIYNNVSSEIDRINKEQMDEYLRKFGDGGISTEEVDATEQKQDTQGKLDLAAHPSNDNNKNTLS